MRAAQGRFAVLGLTSEKRTPACNVQSPGDSGQSGPANQAAETATHDVHFELSPHFGLFLPEDCGLSSCVATFRIEELKTGHYPPLDLRFVLFN